jgi:hypothetical protein
VAGSRPSEIALPESAHLKKYRLKKPAYKQTRNFAFEATADNLAAMRATTDMRNNARLSRCIQENKCTAPRRIWYAILPNAILPKSNDGQKG